MLNRIKMRGRDFEQIEDNPELLDYYRQVHSEYPAWFDAYNKSPKIRIDGTTYDFVNNSDDLDAVLKQIEKALETNV